MQTENDASKLLTEALEGLKFPKEIVSTLSLITVQHLSFDGLVHQGNLIVHCDLATEVAEIFNELLSLKFPIEKIVPMSTYNWDDDASAEDNNSSAFNYRLVSGTDVLSGHSFGRAIDINPKQNPYVKGSTTIPKTGMYEPSEPGTLVARSEAVKIFTSRGFEWGGNWVSLKDYQHFEKIDN